MWILYQIAMGLALAAAGPFVLARRGLHHLPSLGERLLGPRRPPPATAGAPDGPLWLHAVSVGEVGVAVTLARALPPSLPLLVTTVTPTGQERARHALGERARIAYLPFDLGLPVRRFLRRLRPRALILVEGDLWPLLLRAAKRRGLPVLVVNGRVSDRSYRRMDRLRPLLGPLLERVDAFGMQSEEDRRRLLRLGVEESRVTTSGNLKFESPAPPASPRVDALLRATAGERPILVAGSTMAGEEEVVLDAFAALGGGERALLVLAPRHPQRFAAVADLLAARGLSAARRSSLGTTAPAAGLPAVLLLDTLGELAGLYRLAAAAFIGGTLVPTGGHNPLEAARFGVPTVVGPSMENFREIADQFDRAGAWERVDGPAGLAEAWRRWLDEPELARRAGRGGEELVERNRGALERTLALLAPALAACSADGGPAALPAAAGAAGTGPGGDV